MGWIREKSLTHSIAILAVFAALTCISLPGTKILSTVISSPERENGLFELAYHFPDQAGEQAVLNKADDSDYSIYRFANHRFSYIFGHAASGGAFSSSRLQSHTPEKVFDNKSTILVKLRI
jgi:hypothetical protein